MNTLTVDIGNTSIKVDAWSENDLLGRLCLGDVTPAQVAQAAAGVNAEAIIVSSVRDENLPFNSQLQHLFRGEVVVFNDKEIKSTYDLSHYEGKIGPDRIAACLGAKIWFPDLAVMTVDLGTAITIDICGADGVFLGGNISLGIGGRLKTLTDSTGRLPFVEEYDVTVDFGHDTPSAIQGGVINGVKGEILYSVSLAKKLYDIEAVVFTGGDAPIVEACLDDSISTVTDSFLVGRGLNRHLRNILNMSSN